MHNLHKYRMSNQRRHRTLNPLRVQVRCASPVRSEDMKLRHILASILLTLSTANGEQLYHYLIRFHCYDGWWLEIRPDGSGRIGYGASPQHSAKIKPSTFDLPSTRRELETGLLPTKPTNAICVAVSFPEPEQTSVTSRYSIATGYIGSLFEIARDSINTNYVSKDFTEIWIQKKPEIICEPAGGAYVAPEAGAPPAHP